MTFQCEGCWFMNFEGRPPDSKLDEMYIKLIRRANLNAIGGQVVTTTQAHVAAVKRIVRNCAAIRKTPTFPARGPTPLGDAVGVSIAVDMLQNSFLATSRIPGEEHVQFESVRHLGATFVKAWISFPQGVAEGAAFSSG